MLSLARKELNELENIKCESIENKEENIQTFVEKKVVSGVRPSKSNVKKALTLFLLTAGVLVGGKSLASTDVIENNNENIDNLISTENSIINAENSVITNEKEEVVIEENIVIDNNISLGSTISIDENSSIYTDSFKATDKIEPQIRYYSEDEREVSGITYNLNGNLTTIYQNDPEYYEKIKELENAGAKQSAVLVSNQNGYEGYLSIDSIGGCSR